MRAGLDSEPDPPKRETGNVKKKRQRFNDDSKERKAKGIYLWPGRVAGRNFGLHRLWPKSITTAAGRIVPATGSDSTVPGPHAALFATSYRPQGGGRANLAFHQ